MEIWGNGGILMLWNGKDIVCDLEWVKYNIVHIHCPESLIISTNSLFQFGRLTFVDTSKLF